MRRSSRSSCGNAIVSRCRLRGARQPEATYTPLPLVQRVADVEVGQGGWQLTKERRRGADRVHAAPGDARGTDAAERAPAMAVGGRVQRRCSNRAGPGIGLA